MKNKAKVHLLVIAVLAVICLSITSCEFGGTLEIKNQTGGTIRAAAVSLQQLNDLTDLGVDIPNGQSKLWTFSFDEDVKWRWQGLDLGTNITKSDDSTSSIKGGKKVTVTAK